MCHACKFTGLVVFVKCLGKLFLGLIDYFTPVFNTDLVIAQRPINLMTMTDNRKHGQEDDVEE